MNTLRAAIEARAAARAEVERILHAIDVATDAETEITARIADAEDSLQETATCVALGEANPSAQDALSSQLEAELFKLRAARSTIAGLKKRQVIAEENVAAAELEATKAIAAVAREPADALRAKIALHLDKALEAHHKLLRIANGLASLPQARLASLPANDGWETSCLDDRIEAIAIRRNLRRERAGANVFLPVDYHVTEPELLALLGNTD
jgi:hypothetical protein